MCTPLHCCTGKRDRKSDALGIRKRQLVVFVKSDYVLFCVIESLVQMIESWSLGHQLAHEAPHNLKLWSLAFRLCLQASRRNLATASILGASYPAPKRRLVAPQLLPLDAPLVLLDSFLAPLPVPA
mmetsp:Transcript_635/g.1659  ORF Transcript_635/g.1659 Transcript_635/m.1659 type:complete len:126 (-) Transcript_635:1779-2156(-)